MGKRVIIEFDDSIGDDEIFEYIDIIEKEPWCFRAYKIKCGGCGHNDEKEIACRVQ
jgi:hypothetical protein